MKRAFSSHSLDMVAMWLVLYVDLSVEILEANTVLGGERIAVRGRESMSGGHRVCTKPKLHLHMEGAAWQSHDKKI